MNILFVIASLGVGGVQSFGVFHECQFHRYFLNFKMLIYKGKLQF